MSEKSGNDGFDINGPEQVQPEQLSVDESEAARQQSPEPQVYISDGPPDRVEGPALSANADPPQPGDNQYGGEVQGHEAKGESRQEPPKSDFELKERETEADQDDGGEIQQGSEEDADGSDAEELEDGDTVDLRDIGNDVEDGVDAQGDRDDDETEGDEIDEQNTEVKDKTGDPDNGDDSDRDEPEDGSNDDEDLEDIYRDLRNMSLEQRLELADKTESSPSGEEVGRCDFHDYREQARSSDSSGTNSTTDLRHQLLDLGDKGFNAAMIQGELLSNYFDHADDEDSRYLDVTSDPETGNLIVDYYCFAPVRDETFDGFQFYLDPNNYDVEATLIEGRARDPNAPTAAYGVPEDTGRGLAIIVSHSLNNRSIERIGQGAHVRVEVNPNEITPVELHRVLQEARGEESGGPVVELSEEELLARFSDDDEL